MRLTVGVGAEQDDLVRLELLGNLARETADRGQRNVRRTVAIAAIPLGVLRGWVFLGHVAILPPVRRRAYAGQRAGKVVAGRPSRWYHLRLEKNSGKTYPRKGSSNADRV